MTSPVIFEIDNQIGWLTLNRPEAFNSMDEETMRRLSEIANQCSCNHSLRVLVITGSGDKAFSAGGDVSAFARDPEHTDQLLMDMTTYLHSAIARFSALPCPVIAAVNGMTAGAGLGVMACCDLVIASENARFTSAYTQIGFSPDGSTSWYLTRQIGPRRAKEFFITNRILDAEQALDWGLVNRVVPAEKLLDVTKELAMMLASGPTQAYGKVKELVDQAQTTPLVSQMETEARAIASLSQTSDGKEGVRAFIEKRPARFTGH
ncbi:enoyl-CoA hydratase/isomerase family protein [Oceanospirillum sediminis]|uniref:Enoyl-CoA hydratase/isomerase family protein n=1 Tax=Oceanospirillum sediminis TaxID=2760088 RepID=A0A839IV97_9GAMM|nr:enoyl-CoA hydratase-related protein [Oceanospirillum sediminis]MBB1489275.1 enoyl-CoA hydratase/isomerase family protein [Oceanospirillum sediminis]